MPRQLENQLQESSEFMRTLFESAPDAIVVVNNKGALYRINARAESMFGYDRDELAGRPVEILIPGRYRQKYFSQPKSYFAEPMTRRMGVALSLSGKRKNGDEFPVDIMLSPLRSRQGNMVIAIIRDITERREVEESLRQGEDDLRLHISRALDSSVFLLDPMGIVKSWNDGAEGLQGYKAKEIIGRHFSCFYVEEDIQSGKPANDLDQAVDSGSCEDAGLRKRKDGSAFWADVGITALKDAAGELIGFSLVTQDITDRRQAEEALKALMELREQFFAATAPNPKTPVLPAGRGIEPFMQGDAGVLTNQQLSIRATTVNRMRAFISSLQGYGIAWFVIGLLVLLLLLMFWLSYQSTVRLSIPRANFDYHYQQEYFNQPVTYPRPGFGRDC